MSRAGCLGIVIACLLWAVPTAAEDLFDRQHPDANIAMIQFPKSLAVIHNLTEQGSGLDPVLLDPEPAERTLKRIDPARLVPARMGPDLIGNVTRDALQKTAQDTHSDILLVYRREVESDPPILKFRTRGLLYFAEQDKVAPLATLESLVTGVGEEGRKQLKQANEDALKQLAETARRMVLAYKFEQRRSNY